MDSTNPLLWLVRHGETEWARIGRHTGRTDIGLTTEGERQATSLGPLLAGHSFAQVLCSPLQRARETCRLAGFLDRAILDPDCQEWHYGEYEGRTSEEIRTETPDWNVWTHPLPNGETAEQVGLRADRVLTRSLAASGDTLVFAHGHFLRILTARWIEMHPREAKRFALLPAAICVLGWEGRNRTIRAWNWRPNLP